MNVDDRLQTLLYTFTSGINQRVAPDKVLLVDAIAQIKQAFADEGYEKRDPIIQDALLYPLVLKKENGWKTGQEWYDRYKAQLAGATFLGRDEGEVEAIEFTLKNTDLAAKRAAGIE